MVARANAAEISSLGLQARERGDLLQSLRLQQQAHHREPANWGFVNNLATAHQDLGQLDQALALFESACKMSVQPLAITNYAMALIRAGEFTRGFRLFVARWRVAQWPQQPYPLPFRHVFPADQLLSNQALLSGSSLAIPEGRLVVLPDQGYGDTLMALPFVRSLLRKKPDTMVLVKSPLLALAKNALGDLTNCVSTSAEGKFDAWLTGFDIPALLPEALPQYSRERQAIQTRLSVARSAAKEPPNLAVVWRGNPGYALDRWRSLSATVMATGLRDVPGALMSVLPDISDAEKHAFASATGKTLHTPAPPDFLAAAQQLSTCRALVATDTAAVHLAGLMGIPTYVLINAFGDWRWAGSGEDCSWYDSVRLCRQTRLGVWDDVFAYVVPKLHL